MVIKKPVTDGRTFTPILLLGQLFSSIYSQSMLLHPELEIQFILWFPRPGDREMDLQKVQ